MLHQHISFVHIFKSTLQKMLSDEYRVVISTDKKPAWGHARRFNEPLTGEVAVVIVGNKFDRRDIILEKKNSPLQRVAETHRSYDALQYPSSFGREKMVIISSLCRLIQQQECLSTAKRYQPWTFIHIE